MGGSLVWSTCHWTSLAARWLEIRNDFLTQLLSLMFINACRGASILTRTQIAWEYTSQSGKRWSEATGGVLWRHCPLYGSKWTSSAPRLLVADRCDHFHKARAYTNSWWLTWTGSESHMAVDPSHGLPPGARNYSIACFSLTNGHYVTLFFVPLGSEVPISEHKLLW